MKEVYLKVLPMVFVILVIPFLVYLSSTKKEIPVFDENNVQKKVNEILNSNQDKELVTNESYDKFIYLAFHKEKEDTHYVIDAKTGEETTLLNYIKEEKREDFFHKVSELLHLKYPKFIADFLSGEEKISDVELKENELILYYNKDGLNPMVEEELFLHVNYNEVKEDLDFTLSLDSEYENENGYHYDKTKKTVALTFDDGPNGEKTNRILKALEENKAHATFFMVGNRMEYGKDTILNVLNKGCEIGSHSYNHKNMKRMKLKDIISGEEKTHEIYKSITGKDLLYTRPPYGSINNQIKESLNTIFVNWNIDTEDWLHRDKDKIIEAVLKDIDDGDIILMHDSYETTVEAVEELLPILYAKGYQVVSVTELANLKGITLENHSMYYFLKEV